MAGLSSGTVSAIAWPQLEARAHAAVAIDDEQCRRAVYKLAHPSGGDTLIVAGESGACGIAALEAIMHVEDFGSVRERLGLGSSSRVFTVNTEGATDPQNFESITSLRLETLITPS